MKRVHHITLSLLVGTLFLFSSCVEENTFDTTQYALSLTNGKTDSSSHEYVDLGLSVKWATMNVGASSPEDYGDYFAWGETTTKSNFDWSTYKWCNGSSYGSSSKLTKYNTNSYYGIIEADNKTVLDPFDDAALVNWGGSWRMPTYDEFDELLNNCAWTWTTQDGHNGYKVTSKSNGNSIFLPAAGWITGTSLLFAGEFGHYWSSSLYEYDPNLARYVSFESAVVGRNNISRDCGHSVRPVCLGDTPSPTFGLSVEELTFTSTGGTDSLSVYSNQSWAVRTATSWLSLSKTSDTGNVTLTVTASANTSAESRSGTITFSAGGKDYTVNVMQAGAASFFNVTPTDLSFSSSASSKSVSVLSNQSWTVSSDVNWLTLSDSSGEGDATVTLAAEENISIESRSGTITFRSGGKAYAVTVVQMGKTDSGSYEYVDLGLPSGLLWATCNIGANFPEDYGCFFAWGETEPKQNYSWETYKWCNNGDRYSFTKYNSDTYLGTVDNKKDLELSDDAAYMNWGGKWRMPTDAEWAELRRIDNCSWTWTTLNGVNGYKVSSKRNNQSIFFPAAGYFYNASWDDVGIGGAYWSSQLWESSTELATNLYFNSSRFGWGNPERRLGLNVRPVRYY